MSTKYQVRTFWTVNNTIVTVCENEEYSELYEDQGQAEWDNLEDAEKVFEYAWTYWSAEAGSDLIAIALTKTVDSNCYEIIEERSICNEEEEEEEVYGACIECGNEGKFIGKEGDEWTCEVCLNGDS